MPVRISVQLRPQRATAIPPPHTGPAVYAALLRAVGEHDPVLAERLHDWGAYKPFTLTPLLGLDDAPVTTAGADGRFQVGLLLDELTAPVLAALHGAGQLRIGTTTYDITGVAITSSTGYQDIAAGARPRSRWNFSLLSPVGFATSKDEGARRYRPWPDAVRVLRNLADRWSTFADIALPDGTATVIEEHAETVAGDCRITEHLVKAGSQGRPGTYARGCVGTLSYAFAAPAVPVEHQRAVDALAEFAATAGLGDRTAVGMGYVRVVPPGG